MIQMLHIPKITFAVRRTLITYYPVFALPLRILIKIRSSSTHHDYRQLSYNLRHNLLRLPFPLCKTRMLNHVASLKPPLPNSMLSLRHGISNGREGVTKLVLSMCNNVAILARMVMSKIVAI
jgi:hypothetical protein